MLSQFMPLELQLTAQGALWLGFTTIEKFLLDHGAEDKLFLPVTYSAIVLLRGLP